MSEEVDRDRTSDAELLIRRNFEWVEARIELIQKRVDETELFASFTDGKLYPPCKAAALIYQTNNACGQRIQAILRKLLVQDRKALDELATEPIADCHGVPWHLVVGHPLSIVDLVVDGCGALARSDAAKIAEMAHRLLPQVKDTHFIIGLASSGVTPTATDIAVVQFRGQLLAE